jgi:hypothetical protein
MRVVAARFSKPDQASAARDLLERELDQPDVAVAPLAHPGEPVAGDAVLAGRFPDDQARTAVELVESAGGEIVADIDERWTGLSSSEMSDSSGVGRHRNATFSHTVSTHKAYLR